SRNQCLAGNPAFRVLPHHFVEDSVRDLVSDFVGMAFSNRFGCKQEIPLGFAQNTSPIDSSQWSRRWEQTQRAACPGKRANFGLKKGTIPYTWNQCTHFARLSSALSGEIRRVNGPLSA